VVLVTDPALDQVAYSLLTGTGVAIAVVLVLLGVYRLVRRRPQPHPLPVAPADVPEQQAVRGEEQSEEPVVEEPAAGQGTGAPEVEVPEPRDPAEAPSAAEVVAAKPLSRKIPA